ncbi:hypothetical protein ACOMHN_037956 [Nucella lapillus]
MAAPFAHAAPKTRLVFEKSSFANEKSSHGKVLQTKYFTHSANIIVPYNSTTAHLPSVIHNLEKEQSTYLAHQVPLHQLLDKHFIEAFVKRGQLYMLSHKRHIDTQDCVALIPTGHLILHVTKDTYEQLGLEGKPSAFSGKKPTKYVIDVDLNAKSFAPGRKGYDRALWCLKDRLDLTFDLLLSWTSHDDAICASSVARFLTTKGLAVSPVPLCVQVQWLHRAKVPALYAAAAATATEKEREEGCGREALWEWLGAMACGVDMSESAPDSFLSTLDCPVPCGPCERCLVMTVTGLLTPTATAWLLDLLRREVESEVSLAPWASLTLQGFQDSPVSVACREHSFLQSGDNLHTYLCFPNKDYWLYSAYGQHDLQC